ncbi:MAG TPA: rhomboid family intramembrane serine protease [Terriglobales bacterium]|nr:rhomboid family intramembrane serine protease [Terriglobales bacterium]
MIPIRDDAPRYTTPYINYFLLALNILVFLFTASGPLLQLHPSMQISSVFGFVPARVTGFLQGAHYVRLAIGTEPINAASAFVPILTSMFMHGSWWHLIGNMWALYIFGDNIEDFLGHFRYLLFYLGTGVIAAAVHYVFNVGSAVPTVGASGAIAGVMGAYVILYPSARVLTFVPLFFIFFFWLPAWVVLGFWFLGQFLAGAASTVDPIRQTTGGIAVWAHVGGFVAGVAIIKMFPSRPRRYRYFYR